MEAPDRMHLVITITSAGFHALEGKGAYMQINDV